MGELAEACAACATGEPADGAGEPSAAGEPAADASAAGELAETSTAGELAGASAAGELTEASAAGGAGEPAACAAGGAGKSLAEVSAAKPCAAGEPLGEELAEASATEPCAADEAHVEEHLVVCTPPCSTCAPPCSMCAPPLAVPPSPSGGVRALRERGERNRQCKGRDNGGAACGARECAAIALRKRAAASFTAACVAPCRLEVSNCSSARAVCAAATRREQAMERTSKRGERR